MKNRFNLNEEEKNRIRGLHGINIITEQEVDDEIITEDMMADMDASEIDLERVSEKQEDWMGSDWDDLEESIQNAYRQDEEFKGLDEDAGRDTPGGNPEYFYGDGSLDKLRKFAEEQDSEMSKEDIINELIGIYSYSQDGAHDLVTNALEGLLYRLGGFRDDISGSNLNEEESGS